MQHRSSVPFKTFGTERSGSLASLGMTVALALAAACSNGTAPGDGGVPAELTALPRALTPAEQDVRDAANSFAFTLFEKTNAASAGKNVFISPLSVSMALGMTMNGAEGETLAQMKQALGFGTAELGAINQGYRDLASLLRELDSRTSFQIANSIWYKQELPVRPPFLETARTFFDAEVRGVNFADREGTKKLVNDWTSQKTNGRIPTIVDEVHPDDVMYLINAIWFKGNWRSKFDPAETRDAPFRAADGSVQQVPLMHQESDTTMKFRWYADTGYHAGELPYGNGAFAMTIVMPPEGVSIDAFARELTRSRWDGIVASLRDANGIDVYLPKFSLTWESEMKDYLKALGMVDVFVDSRAQLGGISPVPLYVEFVRHKTFVQVDEAGTEAAAVTNVGARPTSLPPTFRVDRPFIFAIRERLSGTILFIGKVAKLP